MKNGATKTVKGGWRAAWTGRKAEKRVILEQVLDGQINVDTAARRLLKVGYTAKATTKVLRQAALSI